MREEGENVGERERMRGKGENEGEGGNKGGKEWRGCKGEKININ